MMLDESHLPDDVAALKAAVLEMRERYRQTEARAAQAEAEAARALAVNRIDALFAIEREINGSLPETRLAVRSERSKPLVAALEDWMRAERARLSRSAPVAKAMDYMLPRWDGFTSFLSDGRICLTNNAAERALRGLALGRKAWLFAGSDRGAERAAVLYTLIVSAKLNGIDPQAWLADVLGRIAHQRISELDRLLPWHWAAERAHRNLAA